MSPPARSAVPVDESVPRPLPELPAQCHKGDAGRVLLICGSRLMPGAAVLALRAATRAGAGLATLAALDRELLAIAPLSVPEAVLLDWSEPELAGASFESRLRSREDHASLVGPGLGRGPRTARVVAALANESSVGALVLDADALNELAQDPGLLPRRAAFTVLTPHPGEAARLLGRGIPADDGGRAACARELAAKYGAAVVLKGRRSVIAWADRVFVNGTGNAGMATAGAGDVLAGIAAAYLAAVGARPQGDFTALEALRAAVHVHGLAGDLAARDLGQRALIASDLAAYLPAAQRSHATCSPARSC